MYVTRPLSLLKKYPGSLSVPPEGPNSGFLVLQDEETETTSCCGLSKSHVVKELPIPQNKDSRVRYVQSYGTGAYYVTQDVVFIPVLNQPLSANRYYVIHHDGKHKGEAYTCSKEEDKRRNYCLYKRVNDVKSKPLDLSNTYQQMEIASYKSICTKGFYAKSVAPDGFPPQLLRNKGWEITTKCPKNCWLGEAPGLNAGLRARLPKFNFTLSNKSSPPETVGKWYCPFMFIKDGKLKDQVEQSLFYEMTLEQRWEQIYVCNNNNGKSSVVVDVETQSETVLVNEKEAMWDLQGAVDGVTWFRVVGNEGSVGLSLAIIDRMKWELERGGWAKQKGNLVRISRNEEFDGFGDWYKYGCYVLVERFVLKRMDGSLVMTYDFKHTHQIRSRWE